MDVVTFALFGGTFANLVLCVTVIRLLREIRTLENRWAEHVHGKRT